MKKTIIALFSCLALVPTGFAQTKVPSFINYQASVTDENGALLAPTAPVDYQITLKIYNAATGGVLIYAESHLTPVFKGRFSVILGTGAPAEIGSVLTSELSEAFDGSPGRYIEITLENGGNTQTFSPRQQIVAVPTAFRAKIAEKALTVEDGAIGTNQLANNAINSDKIANNAINSSKIENNSINSSKISNGSITGDDIGIEAISGDKIGPNSVGGYHIANGSIKAADLDNNAVTTDKIANRSINQFKVGLNILEGGNIKDGSIGSNDLANDIITSAKIANSAVTSSKIADGSITSSKLNSATKNLFTAPHFFPSFQVQKLWDANNASDPNNTGSGTFTFNSNHNIPSEARGVILKILVRRKSGSAGSSGIAFNQSNGNIPSSEVTPFGANGVVSFVSGGWTGGTVFVPFTNSTSQSIKFIHNTGNDWTNDQAGQSHCSIIGYF